MAVIVDRTNSSNMLKAIVGSDIWAWKPRGTEWADYYDATNYSDDAFESKKQIVSQLIHRLSPKSIWDIGSNTGVFSRLGMDMPESFFISTDIDPGAVEINYLDCKKAHCGNVLPLILDLTNPSPAIGWDNEERQSFTQRIVHVDLVMALALIHHLAISNNLPLTHVSRLMASIGKYLIIEFVPKEDSQVKRLLASREDIFQDYTIQGFVKAFENDFIVKEKIPLPGTCRTLFLFERK